MRLGNELFDEALARADLDDLTCLELDRRSTSRVGWFDSCPRTGRSQTGWDNIGPENASVVPERLLSRRGKWFGNRQVRKARPPGGTGPSASSLPSENDTGEWPRSLRASQRWRLRFWSSAPGWLEP
jgi:hypothetical protein